MFIAVGAAITCAVLVGAFFAFVLAIRKPLSEHLGVEENQLRVGRWMYLAMAPTLLLSGWMIDHWGGKPILFAGLLLAAAGFSTLGANRSPRTTFIPLLMLGMAAGWVMLGATVFMAHVFFPTAIPVIGTSAIGQLVANIGHGPLVQGYVLAKAPGFRPVIDTPTAALNFGYVFVALGTLLAPIVLNYLCKRRTFRQTMFYLGLACLAPAALVGVTSSVFFPRLHAEARFDVLFSNPRLWMAVAIMVLYLPLERSLATWATRYLTEMHYDEDRIPRWLTGFWVVFVLSRLAAVFLIQPTWEMWWVFVLVLAAASTLGNLLGYYRSARGARGILVIGGCFGPILPTVLSVLLVGFSDAPATVMGIVLGLGFLSNAIFQPALVAFARSHTVQATVRIPMIAALLLAVPTLMLTLIWRSVV